MEISSALDMLEQESEGLDALVAGLSPEQWLLETPSPGWTIADQIAHLHWTDVVTVQTVTEDPEFDALLKRVSSGENPQLIDDEAHRIADRPAAELLESWRAGREQLKTVLGEADPAAKIAWFGPSMRPMTMITARIMETWAHGLDVFDALGIDKPAGPSLAAVARIGDRTRGFSFTSRGLEAPGDDVRVELSLPGGDTLAFGPAEAVNRVIGSGWGFAAVVTQRRHIDDVDLTAEGPTAETWMSIAQSFAGAATEGPAAGERALARGRAQGDDNESEKAK
jgi:uncharacterized protein (TIGR03084 family)